MALSFPASPTVGQQYTDSNRTWEWNGQTWEAISSADFGTGTLTIPVSSSLPTGEGQIVFDGTTDTLHIGEGVGSVQIAKDADIPQSIVDLGIADGTSGQFLSTDGAGNFSFTTPVDMVGATVLDELTDVAATGSTAGQVLTSDGAGNYSFTTIAGGGATTLDALTDVTAAGATNGQVLTADGAGNFSFLSLAGGGTETVTALAYDSGTATLTFTDETGTANALDLSHLLDNTDTDTVTALAYDSGTATLTYTDELGAATNLDLSLTLNELTDVTAAGSTAGQILSSDGAGAYAFIDHYGDTDVATYLNGNLNTDIVPDASNTYDVGTVTKRFNTVRCAELRSARIEGPTEIVTFGQLRIESQSSDIIVAATRINGTGANTLDIGEATFPMKEIHTNNLVSYTTLRLPINNTANTADGSITWNGTTNKLYVGDGSTAIEIGAYGDTDVATYLNGNLNTHIVPDSNATYDIGSAEFKIRHLFLSDNSLKFVNASNNEYSLGVDGDGDLTFQWVKLSDAAVVKVQSADLDMGGNRVLFANVYTNFADLPDAGAYHGMFAHVHNDAAAYYAHASAWHKLANSADVPAAITDLGITDGTAGQVLTTDGAGAFTFTTVAGGGGGATTLDELTDVTAAGATNGQVLTADGAGAFTFTTVAGGGGGASRNAYAGTTASIADQASANLDVTGAKSYVIYKISTDVGAWVTIYADAASRTADTRTYADKGTDPSTDGIIAEVITTGAETVLVAPGVYGFNNEATPTTNIPMRVFNDSGGSATVTVTVDVLTLEA